MIKVGSVFSGIEGFGKGLEEAGAEIAWQVEKDKDCLKVLTRHYPEVKRYHDVKEVGKSNLAAVDLVCGGFPCQDLSVAGKRAGLDGERSGLWFELARIIDELEPGGCLSKTSLAYYPLEKEGTLPSSFNGWRSGGIVWPGGCLTLNISEWPSAAAVCSLSEVLETDAPPKYYLSPRAAAGILRRAEKRGKKLPEALEAALRNLAAATERI